MRYDDVLSREYSSLPERPVGDIWQPHRFWRASQLMMQQPPPGNISRDYNPTPAALFIKKKNTKTHKNSATIKSADTHVAHLYSLARGPTGAADESERGRKEALQPVGAARFPGMQSSIVGDAPFLRNKVSHD